MIILERYYLELSCICIYECTIEGKNVLFYGYVKIIPTTDEQNITIGKGRRAKP